MFRFLEISKLSAGTIVLAAAFQLMSGIPANARHPIHVSVTEIEYDAAGRELEIMIRIFIDDLETALRRYHDKADIDILNPGSTPAEKLIGDYLMEKFVVSLDSRRQRIRYLGQEEEGQAFICYVLVPEIDTWKVCEVTNGILLEMFDDQSNIVHVTANGVTKSKRLVRDNPRGTFSFEQ